MILTAGIQIAIDPLFQYHTPWFGMEPIIENERYQNAGIAKNFDFDNVIIGNSLSENYRVSDINKAFGGDTVKLTASGSHTIDWVYVLSILNQSLKKPKNVLLNMDPYIFQASSTELKHDIPGYLYDNNYLNDVNYLFNFSIINDFTYQTVKSNKRNNIPNYDSFMLWDDDFDYGKDFVLSHYSRPSITKTEPEYEEFAETVRDNIQLLEPFIDSMKDTEFVFFFSPFSMLYWDAQTRENTVDKNKIGYVTACETLLKYDNVTLYLWTDEEMFEIMSDLNNYVDDAHYSPEVCTLMAERIGRGEGKLSKKNYLSEINKMFDYIENFEYDTLFK